MASLLNVGTRALMANQVALQTAGNNIANVNTPGYSRQTVVQQTVQGQFTGGGYIGNGVEVQTIQRVYSEFLSQQATLAYATQSADTTRADKLRQLEGIFEGGASGLGAAVSDMLNSFADVASAPTDLTARTVVLTRVSETAARLRATSERLDDLQLGVAQALSEKVDAINSLAVNIADVNGHIAQAQGSGQPPNDLLDRRDQLVRELNQYVQTSTIMADDGTMGVFIGGSQALVMGSSTATVTLTQDSFGDPLSSKLAIVRNGVSSTLEDSALGGGEVSGLLRFQNNDLAEGRNLLGRMTLAITTEMNTQHALGLDLDGKAGGPLFSSIDLSKSILSPASQATLGSALSLTISDTTQLAASDYEVSFTGATAGTITRRSDGVTFAFPQTPPTTAPVLATIDGLNISLSSPVAVGDRFLIKPFSSAANEISAAFSAPRALAVASPIAISLGSSNTGSLQQVTLKALTNTTPAPPPVTLNFTTTNTYIRSDTGATETYTPGEAITSGDWSLTLQGAAKAGDTVTIKALPTAYRNLNAGNASAMLDLRDLALFDGAALTDGYAGLMSQIGIRAQSANYSAEVSSSIASNLESERAGVSGVNLDEEAAKLLQFQQAYQASAKMIQISQNIFDTLIQGLGR